MVKVRILYEILPEEILELIFENLTIIERVAIGRVSEQFYRITTSMNDKVTKLVIAEDHSQNNWTRRNELNFCPNDGHKFEYSDWIVIMSPKLIPGLVRSLPNLKVLAIELQGTRPEDLAELDLKNSNIEHLSCNSKRVCAIDFAIGHLPSNLLCLYDRNDKKKDMKLVKQIIPNLDHIEHYKFNKRPSTKLIDKLAEKNLIGIYQNKQACWYDLEKFSRSIEKNHSKIKYAHFRLPLEFDV